MTSSQRTQLDCFVMMPFKESFDEVFRAVQDAARSALPDQQIDCYWLKDIHAAGRITDDIVTGVRGASLCVADLTGSNPNVMWETGYAMAIGKPTILLAQDPSQIPFDLTGHRLLKYDVRGLEQLGTSLGEAIRQTLARFQIESTVTAPRQVMPNVKAISITGSWLAEPARVRHRIETLLTPYLGTQTQWYCGSFGVVDLCALEFLVSQQQNVVAVGRNRYDYAPAVTDLLEKHQVDFLDASLESLPTGMRGASDRCTFFALKSDLVAVLWNGQKGTGTERNLNYFQEHAKNLLIGFV